MADGPRKPWLSRPKLILLVVAVLGLLLGVWWFASGPTFPLKSAAVADNGLPVPQLDWIESVAPAGPSRIAVHGGIEAVNVWPMLVHFWPELMTCAVLIPVAILLVRVLPRRGTEEHCRGCGYCIKGIVSARCPECGMYLKRCNRIRGYRNRAALAAAVVLAGLVGGLCIACIGSGQRDGRVSNVFQWESRGLARRMQGSVPDWLRPFTKRRAGLVIVDPDRRAVEGFVRIQTPVHSIESATNDGRYCIALVPGPSGGSVFGLLLSGCRTPNPPITLTQKDRPLPVFLDSTRMAMLTDDSRLVVWNLEMGRVETNVNLRASIVRLWASEFLYAAYGSDNALNVSFASLSWPETPVARWAPCFTYCFSMTDDGLSRTSDMTSSLLRNGRPVYRPNGLFLLDANAQGESPVVTLVRPGGWAESIRARRPLGFDGCTNDGRWIFGTDGHPAGGAVGKASATLYLWPAPDCRLPAPEPVAPAAAGEMTTVDELP